ncbi:hypothetical protein FGG08_007449 [Glutinoglossum americanum]|uniref:Paf1-domain-containing protein n=1 Tax=Glutinoglossum americanum TaxID=1670608 RepID=A0A9P8L019_9PEZI|nr:hypothetical protein FGG08_007449 [Glutinoglossum americanum]
MASSSTRPERVYHQDYIARIRYSNTLPPPPNPPKLLDIPGTGLEGSQYTSTGFASRLAREQPLNIEADAELGMPLDLVGMPGIFDGDESSIQAPLHPPAPHPHDRPLLRALATLGKPTSSLNSGVSFLRRTEYISTEQGRSRFESTTSRSLVKSAALSSAKKKRSAPDQNDPLNMLRAIIKGFDIAHPDEVYRGPDTANNLRGLAPTQSDIEAWRNPKHPSKPEVKLLDSYPILPDLDAFPDTGGYMLMKFATNPVASTDTYDERLDVGLLRPLDPRPAIQAIMQEAREQYAADPKNNPAPGPPPFDYEYFLPPDRKAVQGIKRKFSVDDSSNNLLELYTNANPQTEERFFRFNRIRAYETAQVSGSAESKYDEVALALYDPALERENPAAKKRKQKGAYYYPILQKSQIRPRRAVNSRQGTAKKEDELYTDRVDYLDVVVRDPNAEEAMRRGGEKVKYDAAIDARS